MINNEKIDFQPIGIIHSPHKELAKIPIQPVFCQGIEGKIILDTQNIEGLKDLDGFSHIYLFFYFNKSQKTCLQVKPYLSDEKHGIFATRAPHRPNKLGMSLVRLLRIEENILYVSDLDILDGTPLLDIKPYIQRFDSRDTSKSGWQDAVTNNEASILGLRDFEK
jgi:tRNA-Thr(GGU) m(6)t(6)A37 methyltransferase TsaA